MPYMWGVVGHWPVGTKVVPSVLSRVPTWGLLPIHGWGCELSFGRHTRRNWYISEEQCRGARGTCKS